MDELEKSKEIFEELSRLPRLFVIDIIVRLITNEVISYDEVSLGYVKYVEALRRNNMADYEVLKQIILKAYVDENHRSENIKDGMLFLYERGQINLTDKLKSDLNINRV